MSTDDTPRPIEWEAFRALEPAAAGVSIAREDGPATPGQLRLPAGPGPHPVAVVVHGGCWSAIADPDYMSHLSDALTRFGWATWSPTFVRRDDVGGAWPGMLEDVGRAFDHLRTFAEPYRLDLSRIVTVGHSSGGHLALWLAARPSLRTSGDGARLRGVDPLRPIGVVGLAPITDLGDFHARSDRGCPASAVSDLLAGEPDRRPDRMALADPAGLLPIGVPQLLLSGELDWTVPTAHVERYARCAAASGDPAEAHEVPDAGHFELVWPGHATWRAVTAPAIRRFLEAAIAAR